MKISSSMACAKSSIQMMIRERKPPTLDQYIKKWSIKTENL